MLSFRSKIRNSSLALVCVALIVFSQAALAGTHIVPKAELQAAMNAASQERQANLKTVNQFLQSDLGQKALASAGLESSKIQQKIGVLSDQELSRLAARSLELQNEFVAGRLTTTQLTYILIAAVAIVLIIALAS